MNFGGTQHPVFIIYSLQSSYQWPSSIQGDYSHMLLNYKKKYTIILKSIFYVLEKLNVSTTLLPVKILKYIQYLGFFLINRFLFYLFDISTHC